MHPAEKALRKLTKIAPKPEEPRQQFLARLVSASDETCEQSEDSWESLATDAQQWLNDAIEAYDASSVIEEFPLVIKERRRPNQNNGRKQLNGQKQHPAQNKAVITEATIERRPKPPAPPRKVQRIGPDSARRTIRKLMATMPWLTIEQLKDRLDRKGMKASDTLIAATRASARDMFRILNDIGKGKFDLDGRNK